MPFLSIIINIIILHHEYLNGQFIQNYQKKKNYMLNIFKYINSQSKLVYKIELIWFSIISNHYSNIVLALYANPNVHWSITVLSIRHMSGCACNSQPKNLDVVKFTGHPWSPKPLNFFCNPKTMDLHVCMEVMDGFWTIPLDLTSYKMRG